MSDAPERIWAATNLKLWKGCAWFKQKMDGGTTEYVRADLHAALEAQLAEAKEALKLIDELNNLGLGVGNIASSTLAKLEEKE